MYIKESKCSIQQFKPDSCKLYPFILTNETNKNAPDFPVKYELASCYMGLDIVIDYTMFGAILTKIQGKDLNDFLLNQREIISEQLILDKTKKENIGTTSFKDFNILRSFLGYLYYKPKGERLKERYEYKQLVLHN